MTEDSIAVLDVVLDTVRDLETELERVLDKDPNHHVAYALQYLRGADAALSDELSVTVDDGDTTMSCGCNDYHYADCPIRTG